MSIFEHELSVSEPISQRLEIAVRQLEFVRRYTCSLLEDLTDDEWYWTPPNENGFVTHIAWQCGHIAMAEYGLMLFRQRGRHSVDASLMSGKFRKRFMRGTEPQADRSLYATPAEIREVMDKVHQQVLSEVAGFDGDALDEELEEPHAAFSTKYGSMLFASQHEMVHAGQIGMLRRLMGKVPLR